MNRTQHEALLEAIKIDKNNLVKYQQIYKYAYIVSDDVFKIVSAEEKGHSLLISLANAMLNLQGPAAIKSISLEMQEYPGIFNKKNCILDIIGMTHAGKKAKHENGFAEGKEVRLAKAISALQDMGLPPEKIDEFKEIIKESDK